MAASRALTGISQEDPTTAAAIPFEGYLYMPTLRSEAIIQAKDGCFKPMAASKRKAAISH